MPGTFPSRISQTAKRKGGSVKRTPLKRSATRPKRRAVSPASPAQSAKVKDALSITGQPGPVDAAHIVPRSLGGCDSPLCIVPLTRAEHREYDAGWLDLEPYLIGKCIPEVQHAVGHTDGSLTRLLRIVSGSPTPISKDDDQ